MAPNGIKLDKRLQSFFDQLRAVTPLDSELAAEERTKFLAQGEYFRTSVSQPANRRHNEWINNFLLAFQRKERIPMLSTLMAIVLSLALVFGGGGATVYAAQGSLPDEILYPVKTWSEDARLVLAGSTQDQLDLTLAFINRRMAEIANLQANGKAVPGGVTSRMQNEMEKALQIAAGMEDTQMTLALEQIRLQAETQTRAMTSLAGNNPELAPLQERLQEQVQLAAAGVIDPQGFRLQMRQRERLPNPSRTPDPTQSIPHTPVGTSYGPGSGAGQTTGTPGHYGPGEPNSSRTPMPTGESYGPGPGGGQATGTPGHYGPGEPNLSQTPVPTGDSYGPGPGSGQPSTTPGGYGPGPQAGTTTCTPAEDGSGPGNPGNGSGASQTPDPGGSQNPTETQEPGNGQTTVTPEQSGDPGGNQPTQVPGQGGKP